MENIVDYTTFHQQIVDFLKHRELMIYHQDNFVIVGNGFITLMDGSIYFSSDISSEVVTGIVALTNCICYEHGYVRVGYKFIKGHETIITKMHSDDSKYHCTVYNDEIHIITMIKESDNSLEIFTYNHAIDPILVRNCIRSIFDIKVSIREYKCKGGNMNIFSGLFDDNGNYYRSSDTFRPQYLD